MAASSEGVAGPAGGGFHTAFPSATLFHTPSHPTAPSALSCSRSHIVALVTPSLITFQPLSNLTAPASFPSSAASSSALSSFPATPPFSPFAFAPPPHVPYPPASASYPTGSLARSTRAAQLDLDLRPAQPAPNHFLRGAWADGEAEAVAGCSLYGAVMTRGNAHLLQVTSASAPYQARSMWELSSLLVQRYKASGGWADDSGMGGVQDVQARVRAVSITAIAFSGSFTWYSTVLAAVGTKDGRVSLFSLSLPGSAAFPPVFAGSFLASSEHITELSFAPPSTAKLQLAVGDSSGVTTAWELSGEVGSLKERQLHLFLPTIPHAPVSILRWQLQPASGTSVPLVVGMGGCDSCNVSERRGEAYFLILAAAVASSVSLYFFGPTLKLLSSYPLPAVHSQHISSLIFTSSPAFPAPVLLSSSASSATYRHLLTPASAMHHSHSHSHSPAVVSPLPARYGLAITADGLLLVGCDVRMADTKSLKKRDGLYIVSVKAWPVSGLDGVGEGQALKLDLQTKKRKRKELVQAKQRETEEEKAVRWAQQHRLLDELSTLCDALTDNSIPRSYFNLCLYLTARLSSLSHLLACAFSEPPPFNPHTSPAHIRFVDALAAWFEVQLAAVLSGFMPLHVKQSRMRTLHFLATFALRCTAGDCQFVEPANEEKLRFAQHREQLETTLAFHYLSSILSSSPPPATSSLLFKALNLITPLLPSPPPPLSPLLSLVAQAPVDTAAERCFICSAVMPFDSLRWAECGSGHRWCRDVDTAGAMGVGGGYVECGQCGGRAEGGETNGLCWMCGVVRARVEV